MIVSTPAEAARIFEPLLDAAGGVTAAALYLDSERRMLGLQGYAGNGRTDLPVRQIMADGLRLDARGLIVARLRTGGDASPGEPERDSARALAETASRLEIQLLDFLIFTPDEMASFRSLGLL